MKILHLAALLTAAITPALAAENRELLVCGWDEVYILDLAKPAAAQKVFSWKAAGRPELPEAYRQRFRTTDDCKAVSGNRILITASSDGVALVDRATGRTTFWGICANAHSADLLPGDRIAVACSVRDSGGNRLAIFDGKTPEKELFSTELYSGHGAYWDESRKLLWALSGRDLRAYALVDWSTPTPSLEKKGAWPLPSPGGHELSRGDAGSKLFTVSGSKDSWLFDRDTKEYRPHPVFSGMTDLKSASLNPATGQWAYTLADRPDWWTAKIRFSNPDALIERPGEHLYKVRWVAATTR